MKTCVNLLKAIFLLFRESHLACFNIADVELKHSTDRCGNRRETLRFRAGPSAPSYVPGNDDQYDSILGTSHVKPTTRQIKIIIVLDFYRFGTVDGRNFASIVGRAFRSCFHRFWP